MNVVIIPAFLVVGGIALLGPVVAGIYLAAKLGGRRG